MNTINSTRGSRWVSGLATLAAILWTLGMALTYGIVAFSDDIANWISGLFGLSPDLMNWIATVGRWLEQSGAWLIGVIWAIGMVALLLLGFFAKRLLQLFSGAR